MANVVLILGNGFDVDQEKQVRVGGSRPKLTPNNINSLGKTEVFKD
jgi:hypothetical protein